MAVTLDGGCTVATLREGVQGELLALRMIEIDGPTTLRNEDVEVVLYVLETNTGIYLPPNTPLDLDGNLTLVSVERRALSPPNGALRARRSTIEVVPLDEQAAKTTADRWYRELIQGEVTQFVGGIPPGRAPDHFHLYEEVLCILEGEGEMWAGASHTPIAKGSCIYLPRRQMHCVENRGTGELRLLGVFYPAGSPAVRYTS